LLPLVTIPVSPTSQIARPDMAAMSAAVHGPPSLASLPPSFGPPSVAASIPAPASDTLLEPLLLEPLLLEPLLPEPEPVLEDCAPLVELDP
jgi:hypothetical protein